MIERCKLGSKGNPIVEIRQSDDHLFSTIGFLSLVRWKFILKHGPDFVYIRSWFLMVYSRLR